MRSLRFATALFLFIAAILSGFAATAYGWAGRGQDSIQCWLAALFYLSLCRFLDEGSK